MMRWVLLILFFAACNGDVQINIGGGWQKKWERNGWINLDTRAHPSYLLTPQCVFPAADNSVSLVYSNHCFEHLDKETVDRVLQESFRTLKAGGTLVIKVPNFDKALECWKRGDSSFCGEEWGFPTDVWARNGFDDSLERRTAMLLGSHNTNGQNHYFGPARVCDEELSRALQLERPSLVAERLRELTQKKGGEYELCHQSAWGHEEFQKLLESHGFEVLTRDVSAIVAAQADHIPDVDSIAHMSMGFWARKPIHWQEMASLNEQFSEAKNFSDVVRVTQSLVELFQLHNDLANTPEFHTLKQQLYVARHFAMKQKKLAYTTTWKIYSTVQKLLSRARFPQLLKDQQFIDQGLQKNSFSQEKATQLVALLEKAECRGMKQSDFHPVYRHCETFARIEPSHNKSFKYYSLDEETSRVVADILEEIKEPVAACMGSRWKVINVRGWKTLPIEYGQAGHTWHTDGFPEGAYKIMIYPKGADAVRGSTEVILPSGKPYCLEADGPVWMLFNSTRLTHRGLRAKNSERMLVEVTIMPSADYDLELRNAGYNGTYPALPWHDTSKDYSFNGVFLGNKPEWMHMGWLNLSETSLNGLHIDEHCRFPVVEKSARVVYLDETMAQLNAQTASHLLSEAKRVLADKGLVIVQLPKVGSAKKEWRSLFSSHDLEEVSLDAKDIAHHIDGSKSILDYGSQYLCAVLRDR